MIERKIYRPWEGVDMFIILEMYVFERPVSFGSCQDLNDRKIFKRKYVNGKKVKEWRKGEEKNNTKWG